MHSKHCELRSYRIGRKTSPKPSERPQEETKIYPVPPMPLSDELQPRHNGGTEAFRKLSARSLQASFCRQAQVMAKPTPLQQLAVEERTCHTTSLAEPSPLELQALEGKTSQEETTPKHPSAGLSQLDLAQLEQKMLKIELLQKEMRELVRNKLPSTLAAKLAKNECKHEVDCKQSSDNNNNNNNNDNNNNNNTTTTNNNNNEPNNYNNNNNKNSRESSLNSFDLDNDNPESEPDLAAESCGCFNPILGAESRHDQHEASLSLGNLGHKTMAIGISLGSLIQQQQDEQEGMQIGTAWDPSLMQKKPTKRVSFDETCLAHLRQTKGQKQQEGSHPANFQLRQLGRNTEKQELPAQNNKTTTAQTCWDSFQQHNLQQQPASALAKELQHKACQNNSLGREERTLGNIQQACRCPSNSNTSSFGLETKNTAAWSILVDTGTAISLAPWGFAQDVELSPVESTLQLRSVNGSLIETYGRRTVQLCASNLCVLVSFVIANVSQALIGMDILGSNQLSLIQSFYGLYLVNSAGALTQLHPRGHLLYLEACPAKFGFSNCRGSNLQPMQASLLNDKGLKMKQWQLQGELLMIACLWKTLGNNKLRTQPT